ncbi:hypothetical protein ATCC90586_008421 [Pythium insidiosum]|nr:hypothetical protein ATCC90586_008421 [Pythium insidiosum]
MSQLSSKNEKDVSDFQKHRQVVMNLLGAAENGDVEGLKTTIDVIKATTRSNVPAEILRGFKDGHKRTAMHFAAAKGRRKVMEYILQVTPDVLNQQDEDGSTPLFLAARENEFNAVRLLLDRGADALITQKNGTSVLHEAAANGSLRTIKLLLELHPSLLNAESTNGTPLHFAVNESREKSVSQLLSFGADVNAKNAKGVTPLILSCMLNKPAIAKVLLAANADVSVTLPGGITVLHIAAEAGFTEVLQELLASRPEESAALANAQFDGGATPLQLAAGKGHREIVELLRPLTKGYEDADMKSVMAAEEAKMNAYLAKATESAPLEPEEETEEAKKKRAILEGVTPDADIVVPEAKELDDETKAKATALKEEGNKAYIAKDFAKAVEFYTQAIALSPADPVLFSNRCAAYLGAGEAKKALNDVRLSKKLKPEWAKAHFREGQCLEALELYEDAAVAMWEAIQLEPNNRTLEKRFQECVAKGRDSHKAAKDAASA